MNRRMNPMIIRQQSTMESPNGPSSPAISPLHPRHVRTGSNGISNAKTKAAAQRLAQVMSNQQADDDEEEEDEFAYDFSASSKGSIGLAGGRRVSRPKSPVMKKSLQVDTCSPAQSVIKKSPSVDAISPVQTKKSQSMDVGISVQMKKSRPVDDDEDFVNDYGLVTGPVTIGRAGGRPTRNPSPMKSQLVNTISPAQVKKSQPVDVVSPAQMMKSQLVDEEEDDYGLVTGPVSIGRVRGRTMKNPSSMKSQPIDVVSSVQVKKSQPVDVVSPAQMKNSRLVNDEEDDYGLVTGPVSIGRVGGRTMKNPSPMKSQPVDVVSSVQVKKSQPIDVVSPAQMKKSQPVNDEDDDYGLVIGPVTIGRAGGRSMRSRTPMKSQPVDVVSPAQVKKSQPVNDEEYDFANEYGLVTGPVTIGHAGERSMRNRSPMMVRTKQEQPVITNSTTSNKSSQSINFIEQPSLTVPSVSPTTPSQSTNRVEQSSSAHSLMVGQSSANSIEQPLSVRSSFSIRSSPNSNEQPPSARSTSASRSNIKPVPMPSSVPISLKQVSPVIASEPLVDNQRDKRASIDFGGANLSNINSHQSTSTLQDEVKMLQEANENLMEKLRLTEERCDEAEERARQLEKQVVALGVGEGISLKAEFEAKSLHSVTQRVILTQEEMEEVVLKRCWLARYWNLCVQHGIHAEVAEARYEYWSSFAPLPIEVVLAAGQRAREENSLAASNDADRRDKALQDMSELYGDGNIESMLAVEKGLRELAFLKVEDAVALAMAQQRRPTSLRTNEVKLPAEGHFEAFELSQDESEDVRFKQAWLTYFWRRAKDHGIELDIAEERLQFWINHNNRSCTSHDAVDVERGLLELRKLDIENQLWQNSRK